MHRPHDEQLAHGCKAFQGISLEDYLLAATARVHRCPLWTRNRKHYPMDDIEIFTKSARE